MCAGQRSTATSEPVRPAGSPQPLPSIREPYDPKARAGARQIRQTDEMPHQTPYTQQHHVEQHSWQVHGQPPAHQPTYPANDEKHRGNGSQQHPSHHVPLHHASHHVPLHQLQHRRQHASHVSSNAHDWHLPPLPSHLGGGWGRGVGNGVGASEQVPWSDRGGGWGGRGGGGWGGAGGWGGGGDVSGSGSGWGGTGRWGGGGGGGWGAGRDGAWGFGGEGAGARMQNANGLQLHHLQQHHVQNAVFSTPGAADRGGDRREGGGIRYGGGAGEGQGNVNSRHKRLSAAVPRGAGGVDVQRESVNSSIGSSAAPSPRKNRYRKAADPGSASPVSRPERICNMLIPPPSACQECACLYTPPTPWVRTRLDGCSLVRLSSLHVLRACTHTMQAREHMYKRLCQVL